MSLPKDATERKGFPITQGVLDYFPDAIAEIARVSVAGNEQHNPGEPLHWAKEKSTDHADCVARHLLDRGKIDADGIRHTAKLAWRALALLQTELEEEEARNADILARMVEVTSGEQVAMRGTGLGGEAIMEDQDVRAIMEDHDVWPDRPSIREGGRPYRLSNKPRRASDTHDEAPLKKAFGTIPRRASKPPTNCGVDRG